MQTFAAMAAALRNVVAAEFPSTAIACVQTYEQLLQEIRAISREKFPAVIVVYDGSANDTVAMLQTVRYTLVLVDEFRTHDDDRALSALAAVDTLMALFPASGRELGGMWVLPEDCQTAAVDKAYVCLALGLTLQQGNQE